MSSGMMGLPGLPPGTSAFLGASMDGSGLHLQPAALQQLGTPTMLHGPGLLGGGHGAAGPGGVVGMASPGVYGPHVGRLGGHGEPRTPALVDAYGVPSSSGVPAPAMAGGRGVGGVGGGGAHPPTPGGGAAAAVAAAGGGDVGGYPAKTEAPPPAGLVPPGAYGAAPGSVAFPSSMGMPTMAGGGSGGGMGGLSAAATAAFLASPGLGTPMLYGHSPCLPNTPNHGGETYVL